jgi:hypothetical protein
MRMLNESYFIIIANFGGGIASVVAPPGYTRRESDGTLYRDGSLNGGPEWGKRQYAHRFRSHRAAARVANKCIDATIVRMIHGA